jgi:hypothetical protein
LHLSVVPQDTKSHFAFSQSIDNIQAYKFLGH